MELITSVFLAYILSGISQVSNDLGVRAPDKPMWAMRPTFGRALLVGATWSTRPFLENINSKGQVARGIAFGLLSISLQMVVLTFFIWGCITAAPYFFDSTISRGVTTAILMFIGALIVLPLISVLMIPLTLIVAWPLDLLFPLKEASDVQAINWCRTCKHHRKVQEYEDISNKGLWRSETMPSSDKLPCNIALETGNVWKQYFSSMPVSRALFPKHCPVFEKRA